MLVRTLQKNKSCNLSFFEAQNCFWNVLLFFSQVRRIGVSLLQIHDCLLLLLSVYMPLWKNHVSAMCIYLKFMRTLLM